MRSFSLPDRVLGWLLPVLAIVAEGALLAVVYVAVETVIDGREPILGTFELAAAAGVVAYATRRHWLDPDERPAPFLAALAALGLVGWLWSEEARSLLLAGNPTDAIAHHPGGWLLLVAGMRGVGRAFEIDDRAVTRLVLVGVPALAIPWTAGQVWSGPLRPVFTEHAFVASLTFVTAGFIAAGLARLQEIGRETGIDWRHDRSWMATVLAVLGLVLVIGIPASILLELPGNAVARGILDPVLTVVGYVVVAFAAVAALIALAIARVLRSFGFELPAPMTPEELARLPEYEVYTFEQIRGGLTALAVLFIALAVVAVVLARVWLRRRTSPMSRGVTEERSIRLPPRGTRMAAPRAPRARSVAPLVARDAVTAYLAALQALATAEPDAARRAHETPRGHARRVRAGPELTALQADYSLARYGGRALTDAEHRRALNRWARFRRALRRTA